MSNPINNTGTNMQATLSQDGVAPVSGMKGVNKVYTPETLPDDFLTSIGRRETPVAGFVGNYLPKEFGESKYDKDIAISEVLEGGDLENLRARQQSGLAKIGNGVLGAVSLAGTTFVRGTAGLLYGIGQGIGEGRFSALWDNDVNNAMGSWDAFVDEQAPIYLSQYEQENPWKTALSAGNISNNLIKNAGFMIGAALSGQAYSGLLQSLGIANKIGSGVASLNKTAQVSNAAKAGYELGKATMATNAAGTASQALISTMSAIGEGSYEAQNNSKEFEQVELQRQQARFQELMSRPDVQRDMLAAAASTVSVDDFTVIGPEGQRVIDYEGHRQAVQSTYDKLMQDKWGEIQIKVHEQALKMGNADMLLNIPLLAVSNWIQFGRLFRGGFKANKAVAGIKGNFQEGFRTASKGVARAKKIGAGLLSPISEGLEEMNQAAVAEGASIWTASELDSFIDDRYDPTSESETSGFVKSMWDGLVDTYGTKDNWLEFTYGALMGTMPIPVAKRKSSGNVGLGWNWEVLNKVRDVREAGTDANKLVEYLNNRVQDPKFQSDWNALVANNHLQSKMNRTTADPFNFKNYEHRQTIHDVMALEKAGKLDLFKEQLQDWSSRPLTETFIDELKDATTDDTGKSWMDGMSKDSIYETYKKNTSDILNTVDYYSKISQNLRVNYGDVFSEDALDEMVYIRTQIQNWQDRANSIRGELGSKVISSLHKAVEGQELTNNQKALLDWLSSSDENTALLQEKDFENVNNFLQTVVNSSDIVDKDQTLRDLTDLMRISISITNGITTYNHHLKSPERLNRKIDKKKEERTKAIKVEENIEKLANVSQRIDNATTFSELSEAIDPSYLEGLEDQTIEGASKLEEAKGTVLKVETARRVAANKAEHSKNPLDRAAQAMIERVTEANLSEDALNPEKALEVYAAALEEAAAYGDIEVPAGLEETFTLDVVEKVEESLRAYQEEISRLQSAPNVVSEEFIGDFDTSLEGAVALEEETPAKTKVAEPIKENVDKPIKEISIKEARVLSESPSVRGASKSMIYTAVPEIHREAAKFADGSNELVFPDSPNWDDWERIYDASRTPTNFRDIYQKLKAFGAFDYLRSHVIPSGTEVNFVADTTFKGNDPEKYGIPIFLAIKNSDTQELQIIGAAPSYKTTTVEKLKRIGESLEAKVAESSKPGLFISAETTKVSVVNDGTFIRSNPNISTVNSSYIGDTVVSLGVVVDGQIYNKNGSVSKDKLSTSASDFSKYEGRPVLLVRAPSGRFKVMPLRTKLFGVDILASDTENPIIGEITKAADKIVSSPSIEAKNKAILDLKASLYLPGVYIRVVSDRIGNQSLTFNVKNAEGKYEESIRPIIISEATPIGGTSTISKESVRNEILGALSALEAKFQISARLLENNPAYEKYYFDSGVLYTDIDSPRIYNSWVTFEDGAVSPVEERAQVKEALTDPNEVYLGSRSYRNSPEGWRRSDGSLVMDPRTVASLNRMFTVGGTPKPAITPKSNKPIMNTFAVGRVGTPIVSKPKSEGASTINNSQKGLENTNKLLIFAKLDKTQQDTLTQKGISEAEFNSMSRDQQDKIIECYS